MIFIVIAIAITAIAAALILKNNNSTTSNTDEKVAVDFYVMSQCPYGTQVEDAISPVLKTLGSNVDFSINYIAKDNGDGTFQSLHGQNEVLGNIVQLCAMKYNPTNYMDMIDCQNKNAQAIPGNWEKCAKDNSLDVIKIKACYEGSEGQELLSESIKKSDAVNAQGSPTIYIAGKAYSGGRKDSDFLKAICQSFTGEQPEACKNIPPPVKVNMIIINDKRCTEDTCNALLNNLVSQLQGQMSGLQITTYDYNSAEGQKIYAQEQLTVLPALLFDETVKNESFYSRLSPYLKLRQDYSELMVGSTFDPKAEVCDNQIDDDNNGKTDCQDTYCMGKLICRTDSPGQIDLFVMSQCPYGVAAENAMKELFTNFPTLKVNINFIANDNGDGTFSSLHGQAEVDENIRQLCIIKNAPTKYWTYLDCFNKDYRNAATTSDACLKTAGIDAAIIKTCATGTEGKTLLSENIKTANTLGIGASPTLMINNRYEESWGGSSQGIKSAFCKYNQGLTGCENTLSSTSAVPSGASC